jgi:hypothetical protein
MHPHASPLCSVTTMSSAIAESNSSNNAAAHQKSKSSANSKRDCTTSSILASICSNDDDDIESLRVLTMSNEIRDFDDLFVDPKFYTQLTRSLTSAFAQFDLHHLGVGAEEATLAQQLSKQHESSSSNAAKNDSTASMRLDDDDEMDEWQEKQKQQQSKQSHEKSIGSDDCQSSSRERLLSIYSILIKILSFSEFQSSIALSSGAFSSQFISQLIHRHRVSLKQ